MFEDTDLEAVYAKFQAETAELPSCLCGHCGACPYHLYSRASKVSNLCFSCRSGLHAGTMARRTE